MLIGKHFCAKVSENGWMSGKTVNERIGCNPYLNLLAGCCFFGTQKTFHHDMPQKTLSRTGEICEQNTKLQNFYIFSFFLRSPQDLAALAGLCCGMMRKLASK